MSREAQRERYDVVVIGAGAGGGVAASRLSEEPGRSVLLLEAGPDFPQEAVSPPAFYTGGTSFGEGFAGIGAPLPELDWGIESEAFPSGRRATLRRGRLVGGSTMINGCIAVRGRPLDFQRWAAAGAAGWDWESMVPWYERVEAVVPIKRYPREQWTPFQQAFVEGWEQLGYRHVHDMNEPDSWDCVTGAWPQNRRNEVRQGTIVTYIRAARPRPNFAVRGHALVDAVVVEGGRATGVRYLDRDGRGVEVEAGCVVVAGGPYCTPSILLRSGIGPAGELRRHGIPQLAELPVGQGLMDHSGFATLLDTPPALARITGPGIAVVARGKGWWSFPVAVDEEQGRVVIALGIESDDRSGTVTLRSRDARDLPVVDHAYQGVIARGDWDSTWADHLAWLGTPAIAGRGCVHADRGRDLPGLLQERLGTSYHCASGCAIGEVVDPQLRVLGIDGLFVADASVFPLHVTNNPQLTVMAVGERAAHEVAAAGL